MQILGIRCSNKDFSYAVMSGTKAAPQLIESKSLPYPKSFSRSKSLLWLLQEIEQLIKKHTIDKIVMKRFEGRSRGTSFEERAECEGAVYIAAAKCGIKWVSKKMRCTIAKSFGFKGRAHYLDTSLNTSVIPAFDTYGDKEQESILSAWSELV